MTVVLTEDDVAGLYGSQHLSADEVGDRKLRWTIDNVSKEIMPARDNKPAKEKLVLSFEGQKKTLVLNTTNFNMLKATISRHPGEWVGAVIGIYTEMTSFAGQAKKGIRLKVIKPPAGLVSASSAPATADADMDDSIPF
jgi:hypothetical protein